MDTQTRTCPMCATAFPATSEHFYPGKDGRLACYCRSCSRVYMGAYWRQMSPYQRARRNATLRRWKQRVKAAS